jgi:hypothetical protein
MIALSLSLALNRSETFRFVLNYKIALRLPSSSLTGTRRPTSGSSYPHYHGTGKQEAALDDGRDICQKNKSDGRNNLSCKLKGAKEENWQ